MSDDESKFEFRPDGTVVFSADAFKPSRLRVDWGKVPPAPTVRDFDNIDGTPVQIERKGVEVHITCQPKEGEPIVIIFDLFTAARIGDFLIGLKLDILSKLPDENDNA